MGMRFLVVVAFTLGLTACTVDKTAKEYPSPDVLYGDLFVAVQMGQVFKDGKTFVDCVPKHAPEEIVAKYQNAKDVADFDLSQFVDEHFEVPGRGGVQFESDTTLTAYEHLEKLWDVLSRKPDKPIAGSSLIALPHPYIVPGGRFREVYYWDSYFTMLGLEVSGKQDMIRHMVDNFAYLIDYAGFIPNGNRSYYMSRSQPPFFAAMVNLLANTEPKVLSQYLPQLEKEYAFWMQGKDQLSETTHSAAHVVRMPNGSVLNRYWDTLDTPRPESYREDVETAHHSQQPKAVVYRHLRSGAESGWDYSARWLADGKSMETIHTTDIIPVDLNALLYHLERTISKAHSFSGNKEKAEWHEQQAEARKIALGIYCWDNEKGFFMDYDFIADKHTPIASLAAVYPLYFNMATIEQAQKVAGYLEIHFLKPGGLIPTLYHTGQQWDAPNGWAPLQWMAIKGLEQYGYTALSKKIKEQWVALNLSVFERKHKMVEKYNVEDLTLEAGGGEYVLQDGFGWTNGVLLKLLSDKDK